MLPVTRTVALPVVVPVFPVAAPAAAASLVMIPAPVVVLPAILPWATVPALVLAAPTVPVPLAAALSGTAAMAVLGTPSPTIHLAFLIVRALFLTLLIAGLAWPTHATSRLSTITISVAFAVTILGFRFKSHSKRLSCLL